MSTTKGPWTIQYKTTLPGGTAATSILSTGVFPHFICHCEGENQEANAALIIRAPELAANEQAAQNDRASFAELEAMLEAALPGFKGCPAPDDWTKAALRELIAQRDELRDAAIHSATAFQNMRAGRLQGAVQRLRRAIGHVLNPNTRPQ